MNFVVLPSGGDSSFYAAFPFKQSENHGLSPVAVLSCLKLALAASMHVLNLATYEGFIGFDFIAQLGGMIVAQCQPDAMEHEPSRLLTDTGGPVKFVGTRAILAIGQHPHGHEPLVECDR